MTNMLECEQNNLTNKAEALSQVSQSLECLDVEGDVKKFVAEHVSACSSGIFVCYTSILISI